MMNPYYTWDMAEQERSLARTKTLKGLSVFGIFGFVCLVLLMWPASSESVRPAWAALAFLLAIVAGVLYLKSSYQKLARHHQIKVLPLLFGKDTALKCDPLASVPFALLHRSRIFPKSIKGQSGPLVYGRVNDYLIQACDIKLTREKIVRKVRRVDESIYKGVVFVSDLGQPVLFNDVVFMGPRASWRGLEKPRHWRRFKTRGLSKNIVYFSPGRDIVVSDDILSAISDIFALQKGAVISMIDGQSLIVSLPRARELFRPAGFFGKIKKDPQVAKSLEMFAAISHLTSLLGGRPARQLDESFSFVAASSAAQVLDTSNDEDAGSEKLVFASQKLRFKLPLDAKTILNLDAMKHAATRLKGIPFSKIQGDVLSRFSKRKSVEDDGVDLKRSQDDARVMENIKRGVLGEESSKTRTIVFDDNQKS